MTTVTSVTSVTGVTGWVDTFGLGWSRMKAAITRHTPATSFRQVFPPEAGSSARGCILILGQSIPRPPAKESGRPEREWLRRPFRRVVPPGTARQGELLALAPCGGVGCGRRSGRPRHPVGALAQGIY